MAKISKKDTYSNLPTENKYNNISTLQKNSAIE